MEESNGFREYAPGEKAVAIGQPKMLHLKIGNMEIIAGEPDKPTAFHKSRVLIDGKPFPVRSITLHADMDSAWTVKMEFFPYNVAEVRNEPR